MSREQAPTDANESAFQAEAPVKAEQDDTSQASSMQQSLGELGAQPIQRRARGASSFLQQSLGEIGVKSIQRRASGSPSFLQQSLGEIRAIQRTAKGEDSTSQDVQQTAQAGVAGAGQALPHADQIQRSFGKHDISGVRAQVGGDAAAASAALGAEAYATGDRVAFARQPDLHTAAHEAAHTIQQRGGKVSRKGLGPANDVHEQDADKVADAVVAGESAEPLLDEATGGQPTASPAPTASADGVTQRKPAGDEKDEKPATKGKKKPIDMPPDFVGKGEPKGLDVPNQAPVAIDFSDLDGAYANIATALRSIGKRQGIAVREVLGNLNEADSPSITDQILKTLAITALGAASGGITSLIAGKLTQKNELNNAIQTALDDGFKDAVPKVFDRLAATGSSSSKATFFASQEEALVTGHDLAEETITAATTAAHKRVHATPTDRQANKLGEELSEARRHATATTSAKEGARQIQYQHSLSAWMTAMAQGSLGADSLGTKLDDELDVDPRKHFTKKGENGVIYVAMGSNSSRPVKIIHVKVAGMTDAARQRIKDVPIRDLKMPIVARGFFYDGFLDNASIYLGDNEMSLGRTETGTVSYHGHSDAREAMMKAAGTSTEYEAAKIIIEQDIGRATLADARVKP